ncbi:MAG: 4-hydroxy-3-methylbut-2-enyl diphosphate reductase [Blautia sp.]|nr:4-hydroxy-3-methylbut-2-enyl diphosphate reductase [Blautia sp.]MCM1201795.1 4-hydroxy-3-methylbut-2-enyl diphosphate reductase [Bacteroides fragilis]
MEVILAKNAGFCFGVKRAVDTVYEQAGTEGKLYTYGPIIHNEGVVKDLEKKGVYSIASEAELDGITEGTVVIRSHGVPEAICKKIEERGLRCVDATCPFVKRIHDIVSRESAAGRQIVVIGNAGHPEVEGILGWCRTPAIVIESLEEAEKFSYQGEKELCVVSQTTYNYNKFQDIVEIFEQKGYNVIVVNTICNATEVRQTEARKIASQVDVMIVIGGNHSSNTQKLYEICRQECENTYFIQTLDDLYLELPESVRLVGITAGASTPNNIIEEVQNYVRINF